MSCEVALFKRHIYISTELLVKLAISYFSLTMSAELMELKFVRRPSVCGIDYLRSYCMDFFRILVVASAGPYFQTYFFIFYEYFSFSLTWDPMGAKISKRYSYLKELLNLFKLFLKFLLRCPHKSTVLDFEILSF